MTEETDSDLWAARCEHAHHWLQAGHELRGYPALDADQETDEMLAATPLEKTECKPKLAGEQAS